jgi:hypothetical protein
MNASDFVSILAAAAPSIEDYKKVGLTASEAKDFRNAYFCQPRKSPLAIEESNELFALMNRWNSGTIEIGMVCLANAPEKMSQGVQVGVAEEDPIVIHADDELAVHELGSPKHVLWRVARSPDSFLQALAIATKFLSDRSVEKISYEDLQAAKDVAQQCAKAAGGKPFYDFYSMLLGAEE